MYNYQCIHHIENKYGYLIIRISTGLFLAIPDHAFSDSTQRDEFKALLESKIAH
ncbi:YcxB family protein [Aggregatibacter aphrophilus]|uniref:YcxB family protein n=1 Tax=Aggregatibacter aphrophilus TaxID=732 RepID=UPI0038B8A4DD